MKYLCLVFYDEKKLNALSEQESQALIDESLQYDDTLRQGGHFITANALQSVHAASTLRVRNGKLSVTDGPFAETNEQIGGFVLIEARDLNEAIQLASKIPPARFGGIEVRPIMELTHSAKKNPQ
ncbi:MAG: YciI family protein [Terriglobales bacterium]